ncbi:hypothetical protein AURDEDRAFT_151522 [Auricularia subglabra TFB-10046 SS5]|nr:hypothetical protein AURDEDRAFT_151522 [Auricularia subglabra TFB-10046 SS5]
MVALAEIVFINNCLRFVPITLLIYDWAVTLDDEVNLIWLRSTGVLKLTFLALRYGPLVPVSLAVFGFVPVSDRVYRIQTDINVAAMTIILAVVQVLLQVRVYVMYNKSRTLLWINAVLFVVEHTIFIYLSLHFAPRITPIGDAPTSRCHACSVYPRSFALTFLTPLLYESYLVFLAARKSWTYRENSRHLGTNSTLSVLVRGSVQYFILVASGMAISLVLFAAAPRFVLWVDMLTDATASLGGTRLILSVRKALLDPGPLSQAATTQMAARSTADVPDDIPLHSNDSSTLA